MTAKALSHPTRVHILELLIKGEATVTDLVEQLQVHQPRVSAHLAILSKGGLTFVRRNGRQRTYSVDKARVESLLAALLSGGTPPGKDLAPHSLPHTIQAKPPSPGALREHRANTPLRQARTCYDHLAGVAGVRLLDEMLRREWLVREDSAGESYRLTPKGEDSLKERGVELQPVGKTRRSFARGCPDWTERRPHLGGALGGAILHSLERVGAVERDRTSRAVKLRPGIFGWVGDSPLKTQNS